nr:hypothetical protein [Kibdelosporangium sp. MJ126-NF4]
MAEPLAEFLSLPGNRIGSRRLEVVPREVAIVVGPIATSLWH